MAGPPHGGTFRILRTFRVAPAPPAGCPALPERALPLTFLDAIWLLTYPVERVFFYRLGDDDDVDPVLSRLVDSLSRALYAFYPLAGRVRLTPGKNNRHELYYQPGDGVALTVAEHDGVGVDELTSDEPREVAKIAQLVPEIPEGGAMLALQATMLLPARRGLALGVTVHHAACDGASSTHFLHTWAAACAGDSTPPAPPVIGRTFIREREDMYDLFSSPQLNDQLNKYKLPDVVISNSKLLATFTLTRENLQSIKDTVAAEAARRGVPPPRCSSIVATLAVMWQCFLRTAEAESEASEPLSSYLAFPIDLRTRMEPRVPDKYLGNCVGGCIASAPRKEIVAAGVDGLYAACSAVAAAVDEATSYEPDYWARVVQRIMEANKEGRRPPLSAAGSPRFRVYDVDFGFGRPAKVEIVSVAKTGAIAVAESRHSSVGVVEVGVALPVERMERLKACFRDAIA